MKRKFTQNLLGIIIFFLGFIMNPVEVNAQICNTPTGLSTSNLSNFSTTLNWTLDSIVDHYRLRYREIGTSSWLFEHNVTGTSEDIAKTVLYLSSDSAAYVNANEIIVDGGVIHSVLMHLPRE